MTKTRADSTGHYKVAAAPRYGKHQLGLFSTSRLRAGHPIWSETPMLSAKSVVEGAALTRLHNDFFDAINKLGAADLGRFRNLSYRAGDCKPSPELKDFNTLARSATETTKTIEMMALNTFFAYSHPFALDEDAEVHRLFANLCFVNHSCKPNATLVWNEERKEMVLRATVEINEGDEILVSYRENPFQPKHARHQALGFACTCDVCCCGNPVVNAAYAELNLNIKLVDLIRKQLTGISLPLNSYDDDGNQTRAVARIVGHPKGIHALVERVDTLTSRLGIQHISFAAVHELHSTVSLAWMLTRPADKEDAAFLQTAIQAKAKEIGVLFSCAGIGDERTRIAVDQLWRVTKDLIDGGEKTFCRVLKGVGLGANVENGRSEVWLGR